MKNWTFAPMILAVFWAFDFGVHAEQNQDSAGANVDRRPSATPEAAVPPRESEVFPFLKDGMRPIGQENSSGAVRTNTAANSAGPRAQSPQPVSSGYLRRLGVPGSGTLKFQPPQQLVEESIPLPPPPLPQRPLISASYSRGPKEWEGTQPIPLRPVTEAVKPPADYSKIPNQHASVQSPPSPAMKNATNAGPFRVEAGGPPATSEVREAAAASRPDDEFQSITQFFQVSPMTSGSHRADPVLRFVIPNPNLAPSSSTMLKSRAVYEAK